MTTVRWQVDARRLAIALGALLVVTAGMLLFRARLDKAHIALLYLLVVLGGSASAGRLVGMIVGGVAFLLFNFLFLPPYYTLTLADPLDALVLVAFLATSVVAAELLDRERRHAALAEMRARELDQLATLGTETLNAARAEQALAQIAVVIQRAIGVERCELFVWDDERRALRASAAAGGDGVDHQVRGDATSLLAHVVEARQTAIEWDDGTIHLLEDINFDEGRARGRDPIDRARALAIPLASRGQTVGVLRLSSAPSFSLSTEQWRTLAALAYYAALGIVRWRLEQSEETAEALRRADRLKDALLATVSHDLRTPLTTIKGIAHEIATEGSGHARAAVIEEEADRLASLVEALLELSQLDAGALPMRVARNTIDDLIGAALQRLAAMLKHRRVDVDLPDEQLLVGRFDFSHSLRILTNVLENAAKYSPPELPIRVMARRAGDNLELSVEDHGVGIPASERERVFQPFYRVPGTPQDVRGAGLGLSIARRLARAQGGELIIADRDGTGTRFVLSLPADAAPG